MAHCSLPIDIPLSPPSYEEAIQTAAPDIPSVETGNSDEPPPSYSEATKDDVYNSNYQSPEVSDPPTTSDLAGLIIASIMSSRRSQQGRQPILIHQTSANRLQREQSGGDRPQTPELIANAQTHSIESRRRKKWSVCLLGAGIGVFLVAGLIAAAVLRHKPEPSTKDNSGSMSLDSLKIPTIDPLLFKWTTPRPFDVNLYKSIIKQSQRHRELMDRLKEIYSTPKPFKFSQDFLGKVSDFDDDSTVEDDSLFNRETNSKKQTFHDLIKQLKEKSSKQVTMQSS